jgi:DNA repair photolyase
MVTVVWADRKSPVLSASSLVCLSRTPGVNLTLGCAHDCIYCYARGYSTFPGENKVIIYKDLVEKLEVELARKKTKPHAIYFSPSSDIFQPVPEVLEISHAILKFLLGKGIGIALLTKGEIPESTLRLLLQNADKVKVQVGIITHDEAVRSVFEPGAASIDTRLRQMAAMAAGGIAVEARIVPILPGITDTLGAIESLVEAVSRAGIRRASVSALFLRPAISASLKRRIADETTLAALFGFYKGINRMPVHASHSSVMPLPRKMREGIYMRFEQSAHKHDIEVSICGCMNPDIGGSCNIAGTWPENAIQHNLFDEKS